MAHPVVVMAGKKDRNYSAHHRDTEYTEKIRKKPYEDDNNNRILVHWFMLFIWDLFKVHILCSLCLCGEWLQKINCLQGMTVPATMIRGMVGSAGADMSAGCQG